MAAGLNIAPIGNEFDKMVSIVELRFSEKEGQARKHGKIGGFNWESNSPNGT